METCVVVGDQLLRPVAQAGPCGVARAEVGPLMVPYNSLHWDWTHLDLADLLDAASAATVPERYRIALDRLPAFCARAMAIAELGHTPGEPGRS
ncbi:hypothetical protein AB0I39_29835 [Kitasatospora purpeofusca]|uniref:hypothetical protein n=1 Tax=Kitasatospora purpeofusca TaxID=67352 RepID=UPI0033FA9F3B